MTRDELLAYIQEELYPEIEKLRSELEWSKVASKRIYVPGVDYQVIDVHASTKAGRDFPSLNIEYDSATQLGDQSPDRPAE